MAIAAKNPLLDALGIALGRMASSPTIGLMSVHGAVQGAQQQIQARPWAARLGRALRLGALLWLGALAGPAAVAADATSVYLEDLTWPELRERLAQGSTTVLVPIGGTEQNGPHMTLGKHNSRVHALAGQIAQKLGHTLVAPVLAYVPEGNIHPPQAHMRFVGTLSIPEATFESVLEATARSLKQHGFKDVFFVGDHGGYQKNELHVAAKLNRDWALDPACRVHALTEYYHAAQGDFAQALKSKGYSAQEVGTHAGLDDTALSLAVDPGSVRLAALPQAHNASDGVYGDARRASADLGQLGVQLIVERSVRAIQASLSQRKLP